MTEMSGEAAPENTGRAGIWLILVVALITCIFSTLDAAVTLVHVAGGGDVGQWPRLLLAGSGLLAGILFDSREHRYVNLFMYCVTVLSVLCIVVLENGGSFRAGLAVFYLSAGFFVVFFTSSFMRLSARMKCPRLWAGLGRAVNNICAFGTGSLVPASSEVGKSGCKRQYSAWIACIDFYLVFSLFRRDPSGRKEKGSR